MFNRYSALDAGASLPDSEENRIRALVKLVALVSGTITFISLFVFLVLKLKAGILISACAIPFYLVSFYFSRSIPPRAAANFLILSYITHISLTSLVFFPKEYGFQYCLLVVPALIWLLFGKGQFEKPLYAIISILVFSIAEYTDLPRPIITVLGHQQLFHIFSILSFCMGMIISMRFFVHYINKDNSKLSQMACTDPLTGLENRRFFDQTGELDFENMRQAGKNLSILMIDLDHFKSVNDNYGHDAGDNILKEVGSVLNKSFRSADKVCRYGGEEFIVLLKGTGPHDSLRIAEELRQKIEKLEFPAYKGLHLTTSIGIAHMTDTDRSLKEMTLRADKALYYAKEAGRNCVKDDQNSSVAIVSM
ncbi:MAG: GGDEF domain-containing protein [Spirochaetales bacterium]|nr:GGDEF domain-containing protein [Spirochaetales bacterium]